MMDRGLGRYGRREDRFQSQLEDQLMPQPAVAMPPPGGASPSSPRAYGGYTPDMTVEQAKALFMGEAPTNTTQPVGGFGKFDAGSMGDRGTASSADVSGGVSSLGSVAGGAMGRYGTGNIPGAENIASGNVGTLEGFNTNAWGGNAPEGYEANSIKNTFGKIASRYAAKPSSLQQILNDPDFKRFFPEAKIVQGGAGDKIDFGDGKPIDVLRAADPNADTAGAWQWGVEDGGGASAGGGEGYNLTAGLGGQMDVNAIINSLMGGQDSQTQSLIQKILRGEEMAV